MTSHFLNNQNKVNICCLMLMTLDIFIDIIFNKIEALIGSMLF